VKKIARTRTGRRAGNTSYLRQPYKRVLIPAPEGGFTARILEFPGCFAEGRTEREAYVNLERSAIDWIAAARDQGQDIPKPTLGDAFSGKIVLRLPKGLHERAAELAELDQTSLNQFLVSAVAARVGAEDLMERLLHRFGPFRFTMTADKAVVVAVVNEGVRQLPEIRSKPTTTALSADSMLVGLSDG